MAGSRAGDLEIREGWAGSCGRMRPLWQDWPQGGQLCLQRTRVVRWKELEPPGLSLLVCTDSDGNITVPISQGLER